MAYIAAHGSGDLSCLCITALAVALRKRQHLFVVLIGSVFVGLQVWLSTGIELSFEPSDAGLQFNPIDFLVAICAGWLLTSAALSTLFDDVWAFYPMNQIYIAMVFGVIVTAVLISFSRARRRSALAKAADDLEVFKKGIQSVQQPLTAERELHLRAVVALIQAAARTGRGLSRRKNEAYPARVEG